MSTSIQFQPGLLKRAKSGDVEAIKDMFSSFLGEDETIISADYFGKYGIIFPTHSFACVTDKKVATLQTRAFGRLVYVEAFIEKVNSGVIYQPSLFLLYFVGFLLCISLFGILCLNAWVKMFYSLNKSGLVWAIALGVNVYVFANRSKMNKVNEMWRKSTSVRNKRVEYLKS